MAQNAELDSSRKLSPDQQNLLLAALSSQKPNGLENAIDPYAPATYLNSAQAFGTGDPTQQNTEPEDNLIGAGPLADFLSGGGDFPYEGLDDDQYNDELPSVNLDELNSPNPVGTLHSKRKSIGDNKDEVELGHKKREGEDKTAKKPGRKPLTSEPTTKRKAQNRAAQRAFRDRKEKHLKDLEDKVGDLEQQSKAANDENGLLRAEVARLRDELQTYRKRRFLQNNAANRTVAPTGGFGGYTGPDPNNFQFEFPRFGDLPGSQVFGQGLLAKPTVSSTDNLAYKPTSIINPVASTDGVSPGTSGDLVASPGQWNGSEIFTELNSPPNSNSASNTSADQKIASGARDNTPGSVDSNSGTSRVFRFNSTGGSNSASPSASSTSQYEVHSSCGTSPEPVNNSGSPKHSVDNVNSLDTIDERVVPSNVSSGGLDGIDVLASQNGGQFDPYLLGDYRESQAAIVGTGEDFSNGFFNEAWPLIDLNSPFGFTSSDKTATSGLALTPRPTTNPLDIIDKIQDGEDVVPTNNTAQMISCHNIWDELQNRPGFKEGSFDIDNLCSELRSKARCSDSGVVMDRKDVNAILDKLPGQ